jgi:membrane associated rhomboid family serine protease
LELIHFLGLLAGSLAFGTLLTRLRGGRPLGSPAAAAVALALDGWGLWRGADWAVFTAVALVFVAIYLPLRLFARARKLSQRGDFARAARLARWVAVGRDEPRAAAWAAAWSAADAFAHGDPRPAEVLLANLAADRRPFAEALHAWLLGAVRDWPRALYSPAYDLVLRARCELGDVEGAVEGLARLWPRSARRLGWAGLGRLRGAALAPVAFSGEVEDTAHLCTLLRLPRPARTVWEATALAAAGETSAAGASLTELLRRPDLTPGLRAAARARLESLPLPVRLGPAARQALARVHDEVRAGWIVRLRAPWERLSVVGSIAVILAVFVLQAVRGGTTSEQVAVDLGALLVDGRLPSDEPWRLLAYGLLHFGALHLATNLVAIALVGPIVAGALRGLGYLFVFVGSIVGAGLAISLFGTEGITLGASGGAMGLMGAVAAIALLHPHVRRTLTAAFAARAALLMVGLQATFDAVVPEVSFVGHLSGGLWGFVLALAVLLVVPPADTHAP